jgi:hypothetical protein
MLQNGGAAADQQMVGAAAARKRCMRSRPDSTPTPQTWIQPLWSPGSHAVLGEEHVQRLVPILPLWPSQDAGDGA